MDWTFAQAQLYLDSRLNYERRGMPDSSNLRLDRVRVLLDRLGKPQQSFRIVHVAGTKGKGSTSHLIASLLRRAGQRVGLHTSPHFESLRERFVVDGRWIEESHFAALAERVAHEVDAVDAALPPGHASLTFFEITTAIVMLFFAEQKVDWGVIEVGMGGRLDSTNVVDPEVSVITSIGLDHTKQLGSTYDKIAREKGGIIKPGRPVVIGNLPATARAVIEEICTETGSPLYASGRDFRYTYETLEPGALLGGRVAVSTWRRDWPTMPISLAGEHQGGNAAVALATIDVLCEQGSLSLEKSQTASSVAMDHEVAALAGAFEKIPLPGRIETVSLAPLTIFDVAHNDDSAAALAKTLSSLWPQHARPLHPRILIFASSQEKEWQRMLDLLVPIFDQVIVTNYVSNPRFLPAEEIVQYLAGRCPVHQSANPSEAWGLAKTLAGEVSEGAPLLCATGSFFLIAELKQILADQATAPTL